MIDADDPVNSAIRLLCNKLDALDVAHKDMFVVRKAREMLTYKDKDFGVALFTDEELAPLQAAYHQALRRTFAADIISSVFKEDVADTSGKDAAALENIVHRMYLDSLNGGTLGAMASAAVTAAGVPGVYPYTAMSMQRAQEIKLELAQKHAEREAALRWPVGMYPMGAL